MKLMTIDKCNIAHYNPLCVYFDMMMIILNISIGTRLYLHFHIHSTVHWHMHCSSPFLLLLKISFKKKLFFYVFRIFPNSPISIKQHAIKSSPFLYVQYVHNLISFRPSYTVIMYCAYCHNDIFIIYRSRNNSYLLH